MTYHFNLASYFSEICYLNQHNSCIKYENVSYTYAQVDHDACIAAFYLHSHGFKRGDVIAIIHSKEYASYILMLACLKLGIIYTNIDPDAPSERFKYIIKLCKPVKIYVDHECRGELVDMADRLGLTIDNIGMILSSKEIDNPKLTDISASLDGDTLAYLMFTSGSTGEPKGVAISHQNLIHFINWGISCYEVTKEDIIANLNPMYFDNSVFDFYVTLFSGATLIPIKKTIVSSAADLIQYVDKMKCTIWFSVPSLLIYLMTMRVLQANSFRTLRIISFGGEGYPKLELKKLYDLYSPRIKFMNIYGPTECTCICSSYELNNKDFIDLTTLPPLGKVNQNFSYLILDEHNKIADEGELCLLGPNVGRGYYNNEEATNKSFVAYTGYGFYHSPMYKTGDIVALKSNLLYFLGRKDNQIKHMGYRIELEEIEIALGLVPNVNQVAVIYEKHSTTHGKIVAYIATLENIDTQYIRDKIINILPSYMIPNKIVLLKHLPKNQNGKVDKSNLLAQFENVS